MSSKEASGLLPEMASKPGSEPRVTILTNFYNEAKRIEPYLESLTEQTYRNFQLLLVDDGSTDETLDLVRPYQDRLCIRILELPHLGLRPARARGFDQIRTELCAVFDADEVLAADCLDLLVKALDDDRIVLACGNKTPIGTNWVSSGAGVLRELMTRARSGPETWAAVGGTLLFRTEVVRSLGGLTSDGEVAEDTALSWELKKQGFQMKTVREAVLKHHDPVTLAGQFQWNFKIGRRMVHTFIRYPRMAVRWESWARFFAPGLAASMAINVRLGALLWIGAFALLQWKSRALSFSVASRVLAFPILVIQSLGWTAGFIVEPIQSLRGKRTNK